MGYPQGLHRKAILLAEALVMYEDSLCKGCGLSGFITYDRHEPDWALHRESLTCIGCEAKEAAAKLESKDDTVAGHQIVRDVQGT